MSEQLKNVCFDATKCSTINTYQDGYPQGPQPLSSLAFAGSWEGCGRGDNLQRIRMLNNIDKEGYKK